jgi:C1A family cysteine protease
MTTTPRKIHGYGWQPDLPDQRDRIFAHTARTALPAVVDLRPKCPPVVDQGELGSCTANAIAGALGFLHMDVPPVSRLFIYYGERAIEGTIATDAGAMIRDGVKELVNTGVCLEKTWPYTIKKFATKPTKKAFTEAAKRKITSYQRIVSIADMQGCLAAGFPFVFGFTVYESFESDEVAKTGIVEMPGPTERVLGGHAVLAVGYDMAAKRFLVRNSWGTEWGQAGTFTMPFAYLADRNLSSDFWTLRK